MIKRINKNKEGLEGVFYIVNVNKGKQNEMWHLRLKDTHFVVSAVTSKEEVLGCLKKICARYKTLDRLRRALKKCEFKVNKHTVDSYIKDYQDRGKYFNSEVESIVKECMANLPSPQKGIRVINKEEVTQKEPKEELVIDTPKRVHNHKRIRII